MMPYQQFTFFDRREIQSGLDHGLSQREIARALGRSPSSISREIRRNSRRDARYEVFDAQRSCRARRKAGRPASKLSAGPLRDYVVAKLKQKWEPVCIATMLALKHPDDSTMRISHETIYQFVYADKRAGGNLYKGLRRGHKQRRKRSGGKKNRGTIPNRVSIDERPAIVDTQERTGDWEGDTIIGCNHKGAIATFSERRFLYTMAVLMPNKRADSLNQAAIQAFADIPDHLRHTLTVDNGKEFAAHEALAQELELDIYFAHPYCSNERAINENTNGLIRQYFPKGTDFTKVTQEDLNKAIEKLNNRPRPKLGYRTPKQMLETYADPAVAFQI